MVNSGSFDSDGQGDRNAKVGCTQPHNASDSTQSSSPITASAAVATCKSGFSQTADSDLPSVAYAIEPTPTKTEFNSNMPMENVTDLSTLYESVVETDKSLVSSSSSSFEDEKTSLCCSLPLDKVQGVLTSYQSTRTDEDAVRAKPIRKLLCLYCDRSFVSANLRQKHVERIHSVKQNRRVSSRRHNQLTVTPCVYCDKLNATENTLKDLFLHLVNEHANKYFGCLPCKDRFFTSSLLADHNAYNHPPTVQSPTNNQNETTVKATLNQSQLKDVKDESSEEQEDVPIKVTRSRVKPKSEEPHKSAKFKEMRSKKLTVKSSRLALKKRESKRLQAMTKAMDSQKKKRPKPMDKKQTAINRTEQNISTKSTEKTKSNVNCINPYPEFDNFYRVKKITDHSIDNLKISSLTFDDVFDKAFFNRIKCNIEENLLHHIDGKLFKNEESENRISNFEKVSNIPQEMLNSNPENYGCELSLNAVTPVASLSLNSQYGEDFESQIEYGSKPSKKKTQIKKDEVHYKYFTRRKYQASILEHKENRDLSKLDMWTQLVIKKRQQKMIDEKKSAKELMEYTTGDEYKSKIRREELNRILDRRGPFEDLREEASKKAALDKLNWSSDDSISHESFTEVREVLNQILNRVFAITECSNTQTVDETIEISTFNKKPDQREIPSYLNLRQSSSLPSEGEIDKSDKIALICSSQETENYELPTNQVRGKNELIELSGEWARCRMYICAACGAKLPNMRYLLDHKSMYHQNVWVQHYEFVGNQSELYRHLSIPALGKVGKVEETVQCKLWRRSEARICTKCGKQCNALGELHRHILECGGDWTWMLVRKKCKYRPFGAKSRRKRRGLVSRIYNKQKTEPTEKKKYKKTFDGPRQRPSDADTIQRMLANLPAKRSTRKLISFQEGIYRSRKNQQIQNLNQKKVKCGKVIYTTSNIKENTEKTINASRLSKKTQSNISSKRRSLRSFNKVLSSRILDTNTKLTVKRKLKVLNDRRKTRQTRAEEEKNETIKEKFDESGSNDNINVSGSSNKSKIRNLPRDKKENATLKRSPRILTRNVKKISVKKLLTGKINIKSFFPVKKRKTRRALLENTDVESANDEDSEVDEEDISTRSKRRLREVESETDKKIEPQPKLPTKKTKHDTLGNIVRSLSIHKTKNSKSPKPCGKQDTECEIIPENTESSTDPIARGKKSEELDKTSKKRKLKQNFKKVLNKVKRLKIDNNSSAQSNQSTIASKDNDGKKSTYVPFLDKAKPLQLPVAPQDKIIIPSTLEIKENLVDISKTALIVMTHETKENPPIPETIFRLESNNEESLQAKGELNFDATPIPVSKVNNVLGTTNIEDNSMTTTPKMDPISIETSFKPKVVPLISPNMKGKIRKPSRGLNDCIAMLTSKLQQKTDIVPKVNNMFNVLSPNNDIAKPFFDQTPHKTECILKIPTFKSNLTSGTEETALDLTTKKKVNEDERQEMFNPPKHPLEENLNVNMPINSVDQIIDDVVGNNFIKVPTPKSRNVWNSIDDAIQNVIDTHQDVEVPLVIRNTVDDIIDFVVSSKNTDETNITHIKSTESEKCLEVIKTIKPGRKIGSMRKVKSKDKKIDEDTSNVKVPDKKIVQDNQSDGKTPLSQAIMDKPNNKINISETAPTNSDSVSVPKAASSNVSLDISTSVNNEKDDLNDGFINNTKETTVKSVKKKKMGKHSRKIGEARIMTHSRGRKKKNPILETNLDNLFQVDEINSNPGISANNIDNKIKFSNEDEPHIMENKVLDLQSISNTRLSDSDDDIPLAALIKVSEGNKTDTKDKITSEVCDLDEAKSNEGKNKVQNSDKSFSKDVSFSQNSTLTETNATALVADVEKLIESTREQQEVAVNTEINIQVGKNMNTSKVEISETVNIDNIHSPMQSDLLLDNKTLDESEIGNTESEKSNVIDNDVLKEQTNNLTGILDVSKDEIIIDKTVQIIKDEKSLKKLSKSPKSQKKRLSKNIDKLSDTNQLVVKKKAKAIKNISDKEIFQVGVNLFDGKNNENKIENLRKSNQNSVLELNDSSEICSNSVTLSNVSVKSNELLNNLFETLTANTKIPDVCSLDSIQLLDSQVDPELLPNENEKGQDILELVRNSSFNKPKTVGRKPKSKSLRKSKSTTEISNNVDNCNISSLSNNTKIMPRKITRSRSLKNMQTEEDSNIALESETLNEQKSKSFGYIDGVQTNVMKKVKSTSDLIQDLNNERLFGDILKPKHHSKKKLGRKAKTVETPVQPNDLIGSDMSYLHSINLNKDINVLALPDSRKKISKKLTHEQDTDIVNNKNIEIEDIINNCDESAGKLIENEINKYKNIGNFDRSNDFEVDDEKEHLIEYGETPEEHDAPDQINEISNPYEIICEQAFDNKPVTKMRKKPGRKKKNPEKDDSRKAVMDTPVMDEIERPKRGRKKKTFKQSSEIEPIPMNLDISTIAVVNNAPNVNLENVTTNNDMDCDPRTNIFDTDVQEGNLQNKTITDTATYNKEVEIPGTNYSNSDKCVESYQIKSITTDTYTVDSPNSTGISYDLMKSNKLKIILNKTKIFIEERVDRFSNLPMENTSTPKNKDSTSTELVTIDQKFRRKTQKTAKSKDTSDDLFLDFDVNASNSTEDCSFDAVNEQLDTITQAANTTDPVQVQQDSNNMITKRPRGRPPKKKDSTEVAKTNNLHNTSEDILSDLNDLRTSRMRSKATKKNDLTSLDDISALLENSIDNNITKESTGNEFDLNRRTKIKLSRKNDLTEPSSTDNSYDIFSVFDDSTDDNVSKEFTETGSNSSDSRNGRPRVEPARKNELTDGGSTDISYDISVKLDDSTDDNVTKECTGIRSNSGDTRITRPRSRSTRKNYSTEESSADISNDVSLDFKDSTDDIATKDLVEIHSDSNDSRIKRQRGRPAKKHNSTERNSANILGDSSEVFKDDSCDNVSQPGLSEVGIKRPRGRPPKRSDLIDGKTTNILDLDNISASPDDVTYHMIKTVPEIQSDSNDSTIRKFRESSSRNTDQTETSSTDNSDDSSVLLQSSTDDNITNELGETQSYSKDSRIRRPRGRPSKKKNPCETSSLYIADDNPITSEDSIDGNLTKQFVEPRLESNDLKIKRPRGRPAKKQNQTESTTNISGVISGQFEDNVDDNLMNEFVKIQSGLVEMSNATITNKISVEFKDSMNDNNTDESIRLQPDSNVPRNKRTRSSSATKNDLTELSSIDDVSVDLEHNSDISVAKETFAIQSEANVSRRTRPKSSRNNDLPEANNSNVSDDIPLESELIKPDNIMDEPSAIRAISRNKRTRSRSARKYDDLIEPNNANNTCDVSAEIGSSTYDNVSDEPRHRRARATSARKSDRTELSDINISDDICIKIQGEIEELVEINSDLNDSKSRRRGRPRIARKNDLLETNNANVPDNISEEFAYIEGNNVAASSVSRNRRTRSKSVMKNDLTGINSANSADDLSIQFDPNVSKEVVDIELSSNDMRVRNIEPNGTKNDTIEVSSVNSSQDISVGLKNSIVDGYFTKNYSDIDSGSNDFGAKPMRKDPIVATTEKSQEAIGLEMETIMDNNQSDSNDSRRKNGPQSLRMDIMEESHANGLEDISLELVNIDNATNESLSQQSDSNILRNRRNRPRSARKDLIEMSSENISDDPSVELETRDESVIIQQKSKKLTSRRSRSLKLKKDDAILKDNTTSDMDMSQTNVKGSNRRAISLTNTCTRNIDSTETILDKTDSEIADFLINKFDENSGKVVLNSKTGEETEVKRSRSSRNKPVINYSENDEVDKRDTSEDVIVLNLEKQEYSKSAEIVDCKKNINKRSRTKKTKKSSNQNAKLNGKIADEFNNSIEDIRYNANASDINPTECKDPVILNIGNVEINNEYNPNDIEIAQVPPIIENGGSLVVKKTDEPPIKIIINKHKTRRKSKSFRKVDGKGQNDLFEDFALVIKKPKGTAPIITFSPADTFSKDNYPNYITKTVETIPSESIPMVDEQIPEEQTDVSVEEMDMELDELPITSGIIENTNVSLTLPVESSPLIDISIEEDVNDKLDNFTTETYSKKNKKKKVAKNKRLTKSSDELPLESSLDIDLPVSVESQEQELSGVTEIQNSESIFLCQVPQSPDVISNNPKVFINTASELMQSEDNEDGICSKQVNKTTKKSKRPSRSKKTNIDASILEVEESVNEEDKEYFNDTLHLKDESLVTDLSDVAPALSGGVTKTIHLKDESLVKDLSDVAPALSGGVTKTIHLNDESLVNDLPDVAPALSGCVTKTIEKVADEIYAFTEIEDLEIEKPLEIPKRLPRKQTKSFTELDTTKQTLEAENSELETLGATSCEENSLKPLKRKQKSVIEVLDSGENSTNKTINNSNTLEEPQDTGRRPVRTAKVKALEHIHDDALADLTDTKKTKDSRKVQPSEESNSGIPTKKNKKPQLSEEDSDHISNVTKKSKKHKKSQKIPSIVDPIDILEEKTPSLADLVADLEGLEELENSIERELNAEIDDKDITDLNQELGGNDLNTPHAEVINKDLDNEDNQELRRSRRGSRKLGSYNENELLEPLLDAISAKRKGRKKESVDKNQLSNEQANKLNSDELFDLLKASTTDTNISKTRSFLNSIDDSSTTLNNTSNLNNMFENILEKSSQLVQSNLSKQHEQNDVAKVYEFSEQPEMEIKEKVCSKNSHKKRNILPEKNQIFEPSDSGTSYSSFAQDTEEPNTEVHSKSKKFNKRETNFCEICNKSFIRLENLIKHKRTLTHIQKLSEIEAKQALEKSTLEQKHIESKTPDPSAEIPDLPEHSKIDININDILLDSEKPTENHSPVVHSSFTNSHSLKLADIINDVLNKPHLENDINEEHNKFSDISITNNTDIQPEFKRYKSLGERKSFDSDKMVPVDNPSVAVKEPYVSKTTILEKQISLLENIIENQTGISFIDDISMSSNRSNSELSMKQDDSSNLTSKNGRKPSNNVDSFLKPTQYEEISEDSANLKSYEDQKLRKTLNRDEELFLECCSLLKSGSEVSSYSNKKAQNKIKINSVCPGQLEEPNWQERRALQKPEFAVMQEYSDDNSRIPTPLGESYADDESNSNTISSNWEIKEQEAQTQNDPEKSGNMVFNLDEVLNCEKKTKLEDTQIDSITTSLGDLDKGKSEKSISGTNDAKKIVTKGARKVFEGLKVSIPTEDLNMEEVLNSSPKSKKNELESIPITTTPNMNKLGDSELQQTRPSRTARKSKPVKKSQVGSNLLFKVNKKKVPSPNTTPVKTQSQEMEEKRNSYDVYDFEETQDNSDIFTKPDFRAFRNMKSGEVADLESDTESRDYLDPLSVERESITSTSVSSHSSFKKPKAQENITKKKCMIMGRIFKNAAKSKIEDIDEEIRSIPTIDNEELVETYVASCKRVIKNEAKPKLSEKEINQLFDQLLEDKNIEKDTTLASTVAKTITKSKPECKKLTESKKRTKVKNRKRVRTNSDSTDDEFQLNNISKRAYRKNAKSEDNCINLEQELKECIGVASRKSQRKCTSGKQNVLVEYWSSDESQFEALLETQRIETLPTNKNPTELEKIDEISLKEVPAVDNVEIKKVVEETVDKTSKPKNMQRKSQHRKKLNTDKKEKSNTPVDNVKVLDTVTTNRRKRAAANPLYHWSSSSEDESQDLIEVKPLRDEIEDDEERPIQHGWIVGDSPKKLVTMLAQAKGKKTDIDCVKEQGKKRTNAVS